MFSYLSGALLYGSTQFFYSKQRELSVSVLKEFFAKSTPSDAEHWTGRVECSARERRTRQVSVGRISSQKHHGHMGRRVVLGDSFQNFPIVIALFRFVPDPVLLLKENNTYNDNNCKWLNLNNLTHCERAVRINTSRSVSLHHLRRCDFHLDKVHPRAHIRTKSHFQNKDCADVRSCYACKLELDAWNQDWKSKFYVDIKAVFHFAADIQKFVSIKRAASPRSGQILG